MTLGEVTRADVVEVVDAPATVVAAAAAPLTAAADGTVDELRVAAGDEVAAGQVVAVVDSPAAERRLAQATEAVAAAEQATPTGAGGTELVATQVATDQAATAAFDQAREAAGYIADPVLREALLAQVEAAQAQYEAVAASARSTALAAEQGLAVLQQAAAATATAQRLQAQQAYDLAKTTVDALTLRAPFGGVVQLGGPPGGGAPPDLESLLAQGGPEVVPDGPPPGVDPAVGAGAPVRAGTAILTIVDVSELSVLAEVDETDVLLVEPGIAADVELDAAPGAGYPGTVTAVDLLPTPSARGGVAYGVRLRLEEGSGPDGAAAPPPRPGMSAVAHLAVAEATGALAVPASAILRLDGQDVVWAVRDGRAARTEVTLGVQGPELVEIRSGLRAGDRIVVSGADRVSEGEQLS